MLVLYQYDRHESICRHAFQPRLLVFVGCAALLSLWNRKSGHPLSTAQQLYFLLGALSYKVRVRLSHLGRLLLLPSGSISELRSVQHILLYICFDWPHIVFSPCSNPVGSHESQALWQKLMMLYLRRISAATLAYVGHKQGERPVRSARV